LNYQEVDLTDILDDNQIEVSDEFEGAFRSLEPRAKFESGGSAVYLFDYSEGAQLVGNKPMIDMSLPADYPSIYK
jgi:hypothetical protein